MKERAIRKLQDEANNLLSIAQKIKDLVPDNLPQGVQVWGTDKNIRLNLPYDLCLLREVRRLLGPAWRIDHSWFHSSGKSRLINYYHKENGTNLIITLDAVRAGSICHIEQDGIKEVPVWKVICD